MHPNSIEFKEKPSLLYEISSDYTNVPIPLAYQATLEISSTDLGILQLGSL
jgi:hypothetical protein